MNKFLQFVGVIALMFGAYILMGFAVQQLWGWFVVPFFHLSAIGIAEALGLTLLGSAASNFNPIKSGDFSARFLVLLMIFRPAGILATGFLLHLFL